MPQLKTLHAAAKTQHSQINKYKENLPPLKNKNKNKNVFPSMCADWAILLGLWQLFSHQPLGSTSENRKVAPGVKLLCWRSVPPTH